MVEVDLQMRVDEVRQLAVGLVIFGSAGAIDVLHPMTSADQLIGHHLSGKAVQLQDQAMKMAQEIVGNAGSCSQWPPMLHVCVIVIV